MYSTLGTVICFYFVCTNSKQSSLKYIRTCHSVRKYFRLKYCVRLAFIMSLLAETATEGITSVIMPLGLRRELPCVLIHCTCTCIIMVVVTLIVLWLP